MTKNIGIGVEPPKKGCNDRKCPFHGEFAPRGKVFLGTVLAKDTHRTATVEWDYSVAVPKYERTERRRTKIRVHNPECIDASVGDIVRISETRPISKTKNFVIIENMGKEKGFIQKMEAREEAKVKDKPEEEPEAEDIKEGSKTQEEQKEKLPEDTRHDVDDTEEDTE